MFSFLNLLLEGFQLIIAAEASIVFFILASLTLAGSAVVLIVTATLFIIFNPILVPATIVTTVLTTGFTAGGTLGAISLAFIRKMGAKQKDKKGAPSTGKGKLSTQSSQNLFEMPITGGYGGSFGGKPFSGTFGNKLVGEATPPAGGAPPGHGFGGFLTNVPLEKLFPGWFKGGSTPTDGSTPSPADESAPPPAAKKPPASKKPPPAKKLY